jgi:hypothetical protein
VHKPALLRLQDPIVRPAVRHPLGAEGNYAVTTALITPRTGE